MCTNEPTVFHQSLPNKVVSELSSSSKIYEPRPLDERIDDETDDNITHLVEKQQFILDPCFEKLPVTKGKKMVKCIICYRQSNTALLLCKKKNHLSPVCSESGCASRASRLKKHIESHMHKECVKVDQLLILSVSEVHNTAPLNKLILKQNKILALKISKLLVTVFNDSKRGTLSAWSWPSREVVSLICNQLDPEKKFQSYKPKEGDLQYINPGTHSVLLRHIVQADIPNLKSKLKSCIAISPRVDGSVDRNQIDNIHVLFKIVLENGDSEIMFMGFEEPTQKGAIGYYEAIKNSVKRFVDWNEVLSLVSSTVTDRASGNIGKKNGLWSIFEQERNKMFNNTGLFIKIW